MLQESSNQELVTAWRQGNQAAAQVLVDRYLVRLTALARSRLSRKLARRIDAEDVVMSAWRSFFVATGQGRFSVPSDDNLWPLLVTLTIRKLARQAERQTAAQRDVSVEVDVETVQAFEWQEIVSREPTPAEAAEVTDTVEALMNHLEPFDRNVLTRRLQGEEQVQIAKILGCSDRTVRRSMQRIRDVMLRQDADVEPSSTRQVSQDPSRPTIVNSAPTAIWPEANRIQYDALNLQQLIGQGGFSKVYRACWRTTGQTVAVKFLKKQFWQDDRAIQSLQKELEVLWRLDHPNIVRILGWGRTERGAIFLVLEWIDGTDSQTWVSSGVRALSEVLSGVMELAAALQAVHQAGVVHGDITPRNVLRRQDGRFFLTDFGFAHARGWQGANILGGTAGFLAPEQVSEAFGHLSPQTDIYGLGGLLYALLSGQAPATGDDLPQISAQVLSQSTPPTLRQQGVQIQVELDQFIQHCLQKERNQRPFSMSEVVQSLQSIVEMI